MWWRVVYNIMTDLAGLNIRPSAHKACGLTVHHSNILLLYSRSYHCEGLVSAATAYILRYFENVFKLSEDFLLLKYEDIRDLTNDDRLHVQSEESVCEAIYQ